MDFQSKLTAGLRAYPADLRLRLLLRLQPLRAPLLLRGAQRLEQRLYRGEQRLEQRLVFFGSLIRLRATLCPQESLCGLGQLYLCAVTPPRIDSM